MKRKLLALLLVMVMVAASACGSSSKKDDSSSSKKASIADEWAKIMENPGPSSESEVDLKIDGFDASQFGTFGQQLGVLVDDNALKVGIKSKIESDDNGDYAVTVSAKVGAQTDYTELTKVVYDKEAIYFTTDGIIDFAKNSFGITEAQIAEIEKKLGISIKGAFKINIDKLKELLENNPNFDSEEFEEKLQDMGKMVEAINSIATDIVKTAVPYYDEFTKQDGDNLVLSIDNSNIDKAYDKTVELVEKDGKSLYDKIKDLVDGLNLPNLENKFPEITDQNIKDAVKNMKDKKKEAVQSLKDANVNFNVALNSKDKTLKVDFKDLAYGTSKMSMNVNTKFFDEKLNLSEAIPENPQDLGMLIEKYQKKNGSSGDANLFE